jgi:hypothetical protein
MVGRIHEQNLECLGAVVEGREPEPPFTHLHFHQVDAAGIAAGRSPARLMAVTMGSLSDSAQGPWKEGESGKGAWAAVKLMPGRSLLSLDWLSQLARPLQPE